MFSSNQTKDILSAASNPMHAYTMLCARGVIERDAMQESALSAMQPLFDALTSDAFLAYHRKGRRIFSALRTPPQLLRYGCYMWGDVGRGKSMLTDLFYEMVPFSQKKRYHFHAFMRDIHSRIHAWRKLKHEGDLLPKVMDELCGNARLICLDELQVHDVTDAMILSKIFTYLFDKHVLVFFTSNRPPHELYQGGIQREQFVQFIELIEKKMTIIELAHPTDYRLQKLQSLQQTYFTPLNCDNTEKLYDIYTMLTQGHESQEETIHVLGRKIVIEKSACGIAWVTFAELCERPLGAADYLELATQFHTMIIQDIPLLSPEKRNEAKRFVTLIDTLYEHNVRLICTAAALPDDLYPKGDGSFEFERTASRLHEMQAETYLGASHLC